MSPSYINRIARDRVWGLSLGFGEKVGMTRMHNKESRIYLSREMDGARFIETLRHEMDHIYTEYKGVLFDHLKDKLF